MSTIQDLETRRDRIAGNVADMQRALDDLDGSEELTAVQRMSNDLDAATRLLAALDRQLSQAYEQQRAEAIAERERRRTVAAREATEIRGKLQAQLFPIYSLTEQLEQVTAEFPEQYAAAAQTRLQLLGFMRACGIDVQTSVGAGVVPVRR